MYNSVRGTNIQRWEHGEWIDTCPCWHTREVYRLNPNWSPTPSLVGKEVSFTIDGKTYKARVMEGV